MKIPGAMRRHGQGTVEYMLVISVLVVGMVSALYVFRPIVFPAWSRFAENSQTTLTTGALSDRQ